MVLNETDSLSERVVAILGGGVLGRRIACCWIAGGFDVNLRDPSEDQCVAAKHYVEDNVSTYNLVQGKAFGKFQTFKDLAPAVENAWLVIEAVPEKLPLKIDTMAELEQAAPKDAIFASNSSSFKSSEMLEKLKNPDSASRIVNMHYMMPPQSIVVELMTCGQTAKGVFPILVKHLKEIGMHPIVARKESTGFVFNRIWAAVKRECLMVLSEGVSVPTEIDAVWVEMYGHNPMGPCGMMDNVGLDTVALIEEHYAKERNLQSTETVDFLREHYVNQGRLGAKSDKGGLYDADAYRAFTSKNTDDSIDRPTIYFLDIGSANAPDESYCRGRVLVGDSRGRSVRTLVDRQIAPDGITYSTKTDRLYWTCMGIPTQDDGTVWSCKLDGTDVKKIISEGVVHTPKQITIDDSNEKLYFCDREGLRVMRCNLDGSSVEVLIETGNMNEHSDSIDQTKWCVGIAISPLEGKFYWTQKGGSKGNVGRIFRANIDFPAGSTARSRQDIECLFTELPEPIDLEVDEKNKYLYWTDRGELPRGNSLNRVPLDALSAKPQPKFELLARNLHEAIGLHLDPVGEEIYTTDLGGTVYVFDMNGKRLRKMFEEQGAYTGIFVLHSKSQNGI